MFRACLDLIFTTRKILFSVVSKSSGLWYIFRNTLQTLRPHKNSHHLWRAKPTRRSEHPTRNTSLSLSTIPQNNSVLAAPEDRSRRRSLSSSQQKPQVSCRDKVCLYNQIKIWATDALRPIALPAVASMRHLVSGAPSRLTMMDFFRTPALPALSHYWRKTVARVVRENI